MTILNLVECKCGCRQKRPEFDSRGRRRFYIDGHGGRRFVVGDNYGRVAEKHQCWKGGRGLNNDGYVWVAVGPDKIQLEHRLIMEQILGRKLLRSEVVHHKNGIRDDNRPENLELMVRSTHTSHHIRNKTRTALQIASLKKGPEVWRGKKHSEETKRKISLHHNPISDLNLRHR